jgi:DNA-binding NtrC family response regulator
MTGKDRVAAGEAPVQEPAFRDKVMILDDDPEFRSHMKNALTGGMPEADVIACPDGEDAWSRILRGGVSIAVAAHSSRTMGASDLLHRVNLHRLSTRIIVTSASIPAQEVVAYIKAGAQDFLERPFPAERLVASVSATLEKIRMERIEIQQQEVDAHPFEMIGDSAQLKTIKDLIAQVAPTNSTILITGESGTGKEVAARAVHKMSKRRDQPFVVVDCGTIPAGLVESELFGHVSGAFTGAVGDKKGLLDQANQGTAFLDEVGEFPLDLQVKLLRVLQDGEVRRVGSDKVTKLDLRIIAATNKELEGEVQAKRFRQDLFYRLNVVHMVMPPLRDRPEDIELFVHHFLRRYQKEYDHAIKGITKGAMAMLGNYEWPGNVRELEHTMLQIMALHNRKPIIEERDLPMFLERRGRERQRRYLQDALDLKLSLDDYAREFVRMFEGEYSEKDLAQALGVTTKTLWQKRRNWGMLKKKKASG